MSKQTNHKSPVKPESWAVYFFLDSSPLQSTTFLLYLTGNCIQLSSTRANPINLNEFGLVFSLIRWTAIVVICLGSAITPA